MVGREEKRPYGLERRLEAPIKKLEVGRVRLLEGPRADPAPPVVFGLVNWASALQRRQVGMAVAKHGFGIRSQVVFHEEVFDAVCSGGAQNVRQI